VDALTQLGGLGFLVLPSAPTWLTINGHDTKTRWEDAIPDPGAGPAADEGRIPEEMTAGQQLRFRGKVVGRDSAIGIRMGNSR
jgi:hypothetical protein